MWTGNVVACLAIISLHLEPTTTYTRGSWFGVGSGNNQDTSANDAQGNTGNSGGLGIASGLASGVRTAGGYVAGGARSAGGYAADGVNAAGNYAVDGAQAAGGYAMDGARGVGNYIGSWFGNRPGANEPVENPGIRAPGVDMNHQGNQPLSFDPSGGSGNPGIASNIASGVRAAGGYAVDGARGVGSGIATGVGTVGSGLASGVGTVGSGVASGARGVGNYIGSWFGGGPNNQGGGAIASPDVRVDGNIPSASLGDGSRPAGELGIGGNIASGIRTAGGYAVDGARGVATGVGNVGSGLASGVNTVGSGVVSGARGVGNYIGGLFGGGNNPGGGVSIQPPGVRTDGNNPGAPSFGGDISNPGYGSNIASGIRTAGGYAVDGARGVGSGIATGVGTVGSGIVSGARGVGGYIGSVFGGGNNPRGISIEPPGVRVDGGIPVGSLGGDISGGGVPGIGANIATGIRTAGGYAVDGARGVGSGIATGVGNVGSGLAAGASNVGSGIVTGARGVGGYIGSWFGGGNPGEAPGVRVDGNIPGNPQVGGEIPAGSGGPGYGSNIASGIRAAGGYAVDGARGVGSGIATGVGTVGSGVASGVNTVGSGIVSGARGVGGYIGSWFGGGNNPGAGISVAPPAAGVNPSSGVDPSAGGRGSYFRGNEQPEVSSQSPGRRGSSSSGNRAEPPSTGGRRTGSYLGGIRAIGSRISGMISGRQPGDTGPICDPPCENDGVCETDNVCSCIGPYYGSRCQERRKHCIGRPPTPMNSKISCLPKKCTATCRNGHEFPDGSTTLEISCKLGEWIMRGKSWTTVPDCGPTCTPKCQNGGDCIGFNTCDCPKNFRGPVCQYSTDECDIKKLGFNGSYKCRGDATTFTCTLSCPKGMSFKSPPAKEYSCRYDKGYFLPANPPACAFVHEEGEMEVIFINKTTTFVTEDGESRFIPSSSNFATCYSWGGQHYKTLSGGVMNFKSDCTYNLLSDDQDTFRILTPTVLSQCNSGVTGCHQIQFYVNDKLYKLDVEDNGYPVVTVDSSVHYIPAKFPGVRFDIGSHSVTVTLSNSPVSFRWDLLDFIEIKVGERIWDSTKGLCGQKEKNALASTGLKQYASSARIDSFNDICEENIKDDSPCSNEASEMNAHQFCNKLVTDPRFAACRQVINTQAFYDACKWEYCLCDSQGGKNCGCETMALFVREAIAKGIEINAWRDSSNCPMECSGGKVYKPCGKETICGGPGSSGGVASCTEGCFCPDGMFLSNDTCVLEEQCHCLLRGEKHPPGAKVPKECNTCTCIGGEWRCTKLDCPGRCEAVGDPHYTTFDGKAFDFMGKCSYYLLKMDNYSIEAENVPCDGSISKSLGYPVLAQRSMPSCTKSVTIKLGGTDVKLKQDKEVTVNGKEVHLPVALAHGYIRLATSVFVQVVLDDGVEVWWDGKTSVFIHAPATLKGKTKGLCGTFSDNQKDDFLTPEGDIEQDPVSFANKWKTVDSCDSRTTSELEHPCDANPQNKPEAEKLCAHLTSNLFKHCHSFVDPSKYHANCLYDVCACEKRPSECLCPILSAYAKECAYQGVLTPWRDRVRECGLACPHGQEYKLCAESCLGSCDDISREAHCSSQCIEGCSCSAGSALDRKGDCIPISSCPCVYNGLQYPPGHQEIKRTAQGFKLCTCENARWSCRIAAAEERSKFPNDTAEAKACPASKHQVYTHCEPSTPKTCKNMHQSGIHDVSESVCYGGCICKKGYVLDSIANECVKPEECPCHHGGQSYNDGSKLQEECNTCVCNSGKWDCTEHVCSGLCTAYGDSHFRTFDDRMYDFQGSCEYMLAKGSMSPEDTFTVVIELVPCGSSGVSCSKSVTLTVGSGASQEIVTLSEGKATPSRVDNHRTIIREAGLFIFVDVSDIGLVLQWDKGTRVSVKLNPRWQTRVKGLCGNFNNDAQDDFQTPSGGITEASVDYFCDSWKVHDYCPVAQPIKDICDKHPTRKAWSMKKCSILKSSMFKQCHSEVPVGPYLENCIYDTCACDEGGDCECLCTALAAYAQECNVHGVHIPWRSQELCPLQCDERCSEYTPCMSTCPIETCNTSFDHKSELCHSDVCVEGCNLKPCPEDMVYSNLTNPECVPRATCKPPCMIVDGKTFYEGDLMEHDTCHSCHCRNKQKSCSGKPCGSPEEYTSVLPFGFTLSPLKDATKSYGGCEHGWSDWFNGHHPEGKIEDDHESLPDIGDFIPKFDENHYPLPSGCYKSNITKVECRVANTHEDLKAFEEDVECSVEKGLVCVNGCHDYEMRVYCDCGEGEPSTTPSFSEFDQIVASLPPGIEEIGGCLADETMDDCAINCAQLCHYYHHILMKNGICAHTMGCTPGCRPQTRPFCPIGGFWRDDQTCLEARDCICASRSGQLIKPGELYHESECEVCQCINNQYVCDTTQCHQQPKWLSTQPPVEEPSFERTNRPPDVGSAFITTEHSIIDITPATLTPPPNCDEVDFIPLADNLVPEAFSASSWSPNFEPPRTSYAIPGIWRATEGSQSPNEYLQIDLGKPNNVYGVVMKGHRDVNDYVTKFNVLYSSDGQHWKYVSFMDIPELFTGPLNRFEESKQIFNTPIEARYIRINPTAWNRGIAAKVDVIGCQKVFVPPTTTTTAAPTTTTKAPLEPKCSDYMSKGMTDDQVTASTGRPTVKQISIKGESGWVPATFIAGEWLQFDFQDKRELTGIVMMGGGNDVYFNDNFPSWVQQFKIKFSPDGQSWNVITNDLGKPLRFHGNSDNENKKVIIFHQPVRARYLKIFPTKWHNKISMRAEILGCYEPYREISKPRLNLFVTTVGPPPVGFEQCGLCPGAQYPKSPSCPCPRGLLWDGETCTSLQKCPCRVGVHTYPVGVTFENELCEQCICALNGSPRCSRKKCPPCEDGSVSIVTNGCGCLCKPCTPDERICPTSNICINKAAWCDGIVDCADDEVDCQALIVTTPEPVEKCPVVECPPGYEANITTVANEVVVEETPRGWSPFGSNSRWKSLFNRASERLSSLTGYKTGAPKGSYDFKKHAYVKSEGPVDSKTAVKSAQSAKLKECPQYQCVAKDKLPFSSCPSKPRCKDGFELLVAKNEKEECFIYSCVQKEVKPPDGKCNVTGRTFTTFDNTYYKYDICDHILARDKVNNLWEVRVMKECSYIGPCYKYLLIKQDGNELKLKNDLTAEYNGYNYTVQQIQNIGGKSQEFALKQVSDTYLLFSSIHQYSVVWDTLGNVKIIVPSTSMGKVDGLCGLYDGKPDNDKLKPDGNYADTFAAFGDSWGTTDKCETHVCPIDIQQKAFKACAALREEPLSACGSWVPLERLVTQCGEALCSCVESGTTFEECRCNVLLQAVTDCRASAPSIELTDWRLQNDCPVECPNGLVYHECFKRSCEPCCSELMVEDACPITDQCFPGCYCPAGYVRDGERCVKPTDCRDCMCEGYDKSRFVPFDKQDYRFLGNCTYILAQTLKDAKGPSFKIYGTNGICDDGSGETCLKSVTIIVKEHNVHVTYKNDKLRLTIDGVEQKKLARKSEWLNVHELAGKSVLVCLVKLELDLEFFIKGKGFSLKVPSHFYQGKTEGLCGNCNLNSTDDFKTSTGVIVPDDVDVFGSSWKVTDAPEFYKALGIETEQCGVAEKEPECVLPPPNEDLCLKLLDESLFGRCHPIVDPKIHVENCHLALCKEEISICQFMESYARDCSEEGICMDWRTPDRCPYYCPKGLTYSYCALGCKLNCDNYKIFQEDLSACKSPMKEGCICPDGQVVKNGVCINATRCEPCDTEGHYPGDEWSPDSCTKCTCDITKAGPQVQCQTTQCPPANLCTKGFKSTLIKASENECCPKYVCVPEPTSGPECEEPQQPVCGFGQVMQLETTANGCQDFTCRCKALEDCDSTEEEMSKQREPGMLAELDKSGCCPRVTVTCKKDTCPEPPQCPPFNEPKPKDTGSCCLEYTCDIPDGKCLYDMSYEEEPTGGERERTPATKLPVLKDFGDVWNDGPCRSCECKEGSSKASCNKKVCGLPPKSESYVYEPKYQKHQCCPIYMRTACKVNGTVHKVGETWPDPEGDPCKSYTCVSGRAGEVSIKEAVQTCASDCKLGWEYKKLRDDQCCGICVQVGCVLDGKFFAENFEWTSADGCTNFTCDKHDDQYQVVSHVQTCVPISNCPSSDIYKEGCCTKCRSTTETRSLVDCGPIQLPSSKTLQLIRESTEEHGACYNTEPIKDFTQCQGACNSNTIFNQISGEHDVQCKCCEGVEYAKISVNLKCADGYNLKKTVKVPSVCQCNHRKCIENKNPTPPNRLTYG